MPGVFLEETYGFIGYDNSIWTEVASGSNTADEDYPCANVTGAPPAWGQYCFRGVCQSTDLQACHSWDPGSDIDNGADWWFRQEFIWISDSLA
ncbi:MAG: hypothetical protein GTO05_05120, partial [Gemmatimonadales bacterium]|nr:hypothetical protein [Gemmatimonadales bacterium]